MNRLHCKREKSEPVTRKILVGKDLRASKKRVQLRPVLEMENSILHYIRTTGAVNEKRLQNVQLIALSLI